MLQEAARLLPCPFCGGATCVRLRPAGPGWPAVTCDNCDVALAGEDGLQAVALWNTRPLDSTTRADQQRTDRDWLRVAIIGRAMFLDGSALVLIDRANREVARLVPVEAPDETPDE